MQQLPILKFADPRSKRKQFSKLALTLGFALFANLHSGSVSAIADHPQDQTKPVYKVEVNDVGAIITRNGQPVAEYLKFSGAKPVFASLTGPNGEHLTRNYPITDALDTEKQDHIHHRSMWFTHGEVNGVDFWAEGENHGNILQTDLSVSAEPGSATIKTSNDWVDAKGKRLLSDKRLFTFHDSLGMRAIDCTITLIASDGPVVFGDTKEGSFGIRVAGTMKVDAKKGGKIVSSEGLEDGAAWGKEAAWVDYYGPVGDSVSGIAILNHPSSFGYPTRWHVRTYGLFAANPFGVHHFVGGKPTEGVRIEDGKNLTLKYRVLLHDGTTSEAKIDQAWEQYSLNVPAEK